MRGEGDGCNVLDVDRGWFWDGGRTGWDWGSFAVLICKKGVAVWGNCRR
jgi:hypothetical protein